MTLCLKGVKCDVRSLTVSYLFVTHKLPAILIFQPPTREERNNNPCRKQFQLSEVKQPPRLLIKFVSTALGLPAWFSRVQMLQSFQQGVCVFSKRQRGQLM